MLSHFLIILYLYLYKSAKLTMGLQGYDYYLDQPSRYHHMRQCMKISSYHVLPWINPSRRNTCFLHLVQNIYLLSYRFLVARNCKKIKVHFKLLYLTFILEFNNNKKQAGAELCQAHAKFG